MISDWNYLTRAKNGDNEACEKIFHKYHNQLLNITAMITGSVDSAKDVVQETFKRILEKRITHFEGSFKAYLTTTAYRLALKEKYRRDRLISDKQADNIDNYNVLDNHIIDETQKIVFSTINAMKDTYKEILVLRFYGNHSYEEISDILNVPIGTVKSRIFYAVKECRILLKKKGIL